MDDTATPGTGTDITDDASAVKAVSQMLESEGPTSEPASDEVVQPEKVSPQEDPPIAEETDESSQVELSETSLSELADAFGVTSDALLDNLIVPVKVNGHETPTTLKDVIANHRQGLDYTYKTQELAEERRQVEAARLQVDQEKTAALERLNAQIALLEEDTTGPTEEYLNQLMADGRTDEYVQAAHQRQLRDKKLREAKTLRDEEAKKVREQQEAEYAKWRKQQIDTVTDKFGLHDAKKAEAFANDVASTLRHHGFSDQEISVFAGNYDARYASVIEAASRAFKLEKGAKDSLKKIEGKPKPVKPGQPLTRKQSQDDKLGAARKRMIKVGRERSKSAGEDAAAQWVSQLLQRGA